MASLYDILSLGLEPVAMWGRGEGEIIYSSLSRKKRRKEILRRIGRGLIFMYNRLN